MSSQSGLTLAVSTVVRGFLSESEVTGAQLASHMGRGATYVSDRQKGHRSWTVGDLDDIARLIGAEPMDFALEVMRRAEAKLRGWEADRLHGIPSPLDSLRGHDAVTAADSAGHARTGA